MRNVARRLVLLGIGGLIGWGLVMLLTLEPNWYLFLLWTLVICVGGMIRLRSNEDE